MLAILTSLTRRQKWAILLTLDMVLVPLAVVISAFLDGRGPGMEGWLSSLALLSVPLTACAAALSLGLGSARVRLNAYEGREVARTAAQGALLAMVGWLLVRALGLPYAGNFMAIFGMVYVLLTIGARFVMQQALVEVYRRGSEATRVLIYGAGGTGMQLAGALRSHQTIHAVAFLDDNASLQSATVAGLPVYHPGRAAQLIRRKRIDRAILAMPSVSPPKQAQIVRRLQKLGLEVQVLPSFAQLVGEEALLDKLTLVQPGQLLGRAPLDSVLDQAQGSYRGLDVLVSGAGGTIGSELCRQLLDAGVRHLILFEMSEFALYTIESELSTLAEGRDVRITPVLGSTTDPRLVRMVLERHKPQVILHAAAYKHVPIVEANPLAGLVNNVLGTRTLARAAKEAGVARFILISSDKAVRPTNVMGASKRLAELMVQDLAAQTNRTQFSMVRFGNVVGSSGSVIPRFQDQIARGGPVTVTHPDVTRFFMTVSEAVGLVLLAGSFEQDSDRGDVFVLDMGRPVKIAHLARQMIEKAGYTVRDAANPEGDIEIVVTGLRPGEKLHEELLIGSGILPTPHPKILRAREEALSALEVAQVLRELRHVAATGDEREARTVIKRWVAGYQPFRVVASPDLSAPLAVVPSSSVGEAKL